jgi:BlaI family transcriptional regulator, penicillinase repressor
MSNKRTAPRLGAGEMEILQMLWREGPVTISEAQHALGRPIGYTTVQTRLNRLFDKGVVTRSKDRPSHYRAAVAPGAVSAPHLDMLLERVSGGSIVPLVAHLMKGRSLTADEIAAIKRLLAETEQDAEDQESQGQRP